jgi:hypothetical protein
MASISVILRVVAALFFILAAIGSDSRVNLQALGLFFLTLSMLV